MNGEHVVNRGHMTREQCENVDFLGDSMNEFFGKFGEDFWAFTILKVR